MRVDIKRECGTRVSKLFGYDFRRHANAQGKSRGSVPQIVESDVWQTCLFQDWFEVLVDKAIHIYWSAKLRDEDQIDGFRPLFRIDNRIFFLTPF